MNGTKPTPLHLAPAEDLPARKRRPGASRARRVEELRRGNVNAWRHGIMAEVSARPDVAIEVALIFASRPALDPLRDTRLVEHLAMVTARCRRIHLEIEAHGPTPVLTSYDARMSPLQERLERSVHEREQQRIREAATAQRSAGLEHYRSDRAGSGDES